MRHLGSPPRSAVPLLVLALALVVGAFAVGSGLARLVVAVLAVCALVVFLLRWKQAIVRRGDHPEFGDDPESYRRHFGDSIVDARTQVDPKVGMRPVDTTRDR